MTANASSIAMVCIHCGGKEADSQTGRCPSCGKVVVSPSIANEFSHPILGQGRHSPSASYRAAPAIEATPPSEPPRLQIVAEEPLPSAPTPPSLTFNLPENAATTKWIAETKQLRDKLIAQAERAESQIGELQAEAAKNRESAEAFTRLLDAIAIGDAPLAVEARPTVPAPTPSTSRSRGKWSKNADHCIDCGRSDVPHLALDRCRTCYDAKRAREAARGA